MNTENIKVCTGRNGKIARLPLAIREELNIRLRDGEEGVELVLWLNGLPEVRQILAARFKGQPISECNLTNWKKGGYAEWFLLHLVPETPVNAVLTMPPEAIAQGQGGLTDKMALMLSCHMVAELKRHPLASNSEAEAKLWRHLSVILTNLKRFEHLARKTNREETREREAKKREDEKNKPLSEEEKERRVALILGLDPDRPQVNPETDLFEGPGADALNAQREWLKQAFKERDARMAAECQAQNPPEPHLNPPE